MYWPCSTGVMVDVTLAPKASFHIDCTSAPVSTLNGSFVVSNRKSMESVPNSPRHWSISWFARSRS